jgi:AraC-like DNA-binding protein
MADAVIAALALDEDLPGVGVGSTAATIGLPRRTLQCALRREGVSYRDILRRLRIRRAQQLLATTEQPLAEISLRAGYSDASNFHRAFVSLTGMTPGRFRDQSTANRFNLA